MTTKNDDHANLDRELSEEFTARFTSLGADELPGYRDEYTEEELLNYEGNELQTIAWHHTISDRVPYSP